MKQRIINGYCEQQRYDYQVKVNVVESKTTESSEEYCGTYDCKYKRDGNICSQSSCSVLSSNNIFVGEKM